MKRPAFHTVSAEAIKQGRVTDVYFVRTLEILKRKGLAGKRGLAELTTGGLPREWPWAVFCGLEEAVCLLEGIPVDVSALPEGTIFPAKDFAGNRVPVMTIEGPYSRFCLYETALLGMICQATGVATQSARIRKAAKNALLLGFGTRRMHPAIAPMLDRASFIGGCDGVSNVAGAERIGESARGTMPHALIVAFGEAQAAWAAFDEVMPASVPRIALVDTYSDEKEEVLKAARLLGKRLSGVRLDTPSSRRGNFPDLVREIRWELNLRGYRHVRIIVSGGMDEEQIPALVQAGAEGFGVGTSISSASPVDFAMDLVEMAGRPCAKRGRLGGRKTVWGCSRCLAVHVRAATERISACPGCRSRKVNPLLKPVLRKGKRVGRLPKVGAIRSTVLDQLRRRDA